LPPLFLTNYIILKNFFIKNLFFAQAQTGEREKKIKTNPSMSCFLIPLFFKDEAIERFYAGKN